LIGFVVACFRFNNTGRGGHYYSALTVFNEIRKRRRAALIVVGDQRPAAIDTSAPGIHYVHTGRMVCGSDVDLLVDLVSQHGIGVLHAFDAYAFLFSRLAARRMDLRVVATKCGGPTPRFRYYPGLSPDTVFSPEDYEFFRRRAARFRMPPPVLLPNRVAEPVQRSEPQGTVGLPDPVPQGAVRIIRIARICQAYEQSILQTVSLANALRSKGMDVTVYVVGYLEDRRVFERVRNAVHASDYVLTDDRHTLGASRYLQAVDIAVASGRGVMEASISRKIVLCSVTGSALPYLLDAESASHFLHYNFSSRAPKPPISQQSNLDRIAQLIADEAYRAQHLERMEPIVDRYFRISEAVSSYLSLYDAKRVVRHPVFEALDARIHWLVAVLRLGRRKLRQTVQAGERSSDNGGSK